MASRTCFLVASVHFDQRQRSLALAWPKSSAPYFTGAGLVSTNSACAGASAVLDLEHLSRSRSSGIVHVAAQARRDVGRPPKCSRRRLAQETHGAGILAGELQEALLALSLVKGRARMS